MATPPSCLLALFLSYGPSILGGFDWSLVSARSRKCASYVSAAVFRLAVLLVIPLGFANRIRMFLYFSPFFEEK